MMYKRLRRILRILHVEKEEQIKVNKQFDGAKRGPYFGWRASRAKVDAVKNFNNNNMPSTNEIIREMIK